MDWLEQANERKRQRLAQDNRNALASAAQLRNQEIRDIDGVGRWVAQLPADLTPLFARYPELDPKQNTDPELRAKAWRSWLKGSASEPYKFRTNL